MCVYNYCMLWNNWEFIFSNCLNSQCTMFILIIKTDHQKDTNTVVMSAILFQQEPFYKQTFDLWRSNSIGISSWTQCDSMQLGGDQSNLNYPGEAEKVHGWTDKTLNMCPPPHATGWQAESLHLFTASINPLTHKKHTEIQFCTVCILNKRRYIKNTVTTIQEMRCCACVSQHNPGLAVNEFVCIAFKKMLNKIYILFSKIQDFLLKISITYTQQYFCQKLERNVWMKSFSGQKNAFCLKLLPCTWYM